MASPRSVTRRYRAAHNIGHFRFVECSRLTDGRPDGDVTPYDPVFFPFDPDLHDEDDLGAAGRPQGVRAGCRGALRRHAKRGSGRDYHNAADGPDADVPAGTHAHASLSGLAPRLASVTAAPCMVWIPPHCEGACGGSRHQMRV